MVNRQNSQTKNVRFSGRLAAVVGLFLILSLGISSAAFAQNDPTFVEQVGQIEADDLGIVNPAGLAFSPADNVLHVVQARQPGRSPGTYSEILTITPAQGRVGSVRVRPAIPDPINMAFDGRANRLLFYEPAARRFIEIAAGPEGRLDPTVVARHSAWRFGLRSPRGMAVDPATGHLFLLDGTGPRLIRIEPDLDGGFHQAAISRVDLAQANLPDLRGLAFDPTDGHLYSFSRAEQALVELSPAGDVVGIQDVSSLILNEPQSMVFVPSRALMDEPTRMNLYIADSGLGAGQDGGVDRQSEGQIVELSFAQAAAAAASTFYASLVQTIHTSLFSPPCPDPQGLTYIGASDTLSDTLLIADSEVDEMPIYAGANMFKMTLSGILTDTWTTVPFSNEPTGVSHNPDNGHLFISDDNKKRIFELNPGDDGIYRTEDDILTSFLTTGFGCNDPEDVAYARDLKALFIADEASSRIFKLTPGDNGRFDGPPTQGDDDVTSFDTTRVGVGAPEAVTYNPENGLLYIAGNSAYLVAETTTEGTLVRMINIAASNITRPGGIASGPSSLDPDVTHLYIADSGVDNNTDPNENDGKVYEMTLPPTVPDLSIVKAVEPAGAVPGALITYTLTFYNGGEGTATGVVITDIIPVSVTVQSVVSSGVAITDTGAVPHYAWQVEDLAPAEGGVITITAALSLNLPCWYTFSNTASITNTAGDSDPDNNSSEASVTVGGGVTVSPPSDAASADPGTEVVYTLQVANSGSCIDTYDLALSGNTWSIAAAATVGSLAPGVSASVPVTVTVPADARCGDDVATVTLTSQGDGVSSDSSILTTTANTIRGVTVSPASDAASADPGAKVVYTLQVTNTGNCTDTFDLALSGNTWDTDAPATVGPLAAGASASVPVTVTVPTGALCSDGDGVTVAFTSQDGTTSASSDLTTSANRVNAVTVVPPSDSAGGDWGTTVAYTLRLTNTGNCTDTFSRAVSGNVWSVSAPVKVGPLAPGAGADVPVSVGVPTGARCGDVDSATITFTSQDDGTTSASSDLTTTANTVRGVTLDPPSDTVSADPGAEVVYILQVTNTGNCTDTFDLDVSGNIWNTEAPTTVGPLAADAGASVPVTVTVPTDALCGDDVATITVTSQDDGTASDSSLLTTTAKTVRGVAVSPPSDDASGDPGAKVVYTLQVTNTGNCADTFDLEVSGNAWDTDAPATVDSLAPGVTASVPVTVTVPAGALCEDDDSATVTVTSQHDGAASDSSLLTTTANTVRGVAVSPPSDDASGDPGTKVAYTLQVTNAGNCADTFDLAVSGNTWDTDAPATVGSLAPYSGISVPVTVTVPTDAGCGDDDSATITFTSQHDGAVTDSSLLATSANTVCGVTMTPPSDAAWADAGAEVVYTLQVTNTGNCTDTFELEVSGNSWGTDAPSTVGPLAPGVSASLGVTVSVPLGAQCGDDVAIITSTSQGDGSISASSELTTSVITVRGVTVEPSAGAAWGDPGTKAVHTLQVTNTGNCTDTFDLALSGNTWDSDAPATVGPLAPGVSASVPVTVTVPTDAGCGDDDSITVTITSQHDGAAADSSLLSTTANRVNGVTVVPPSDSAGGDPGTIVAYTLQLTNTGNCTDTFSRAASGNEWPVSVPVKVGPLAPGAGADVPVNVTVPVCIAGGSSDTVTLSFASQDDGAVSDSATLTTAANQAAPVAEDDEYTVLEDKSLSVPAPGVLVNDSDANCDDLTASLDTLPSHGTVVLDLNGSFSYTPTANFEGIDTFTYSAHGGFLADTATVSLTVTSGGDNPIVDAGEDQTVNEADTVHFSGSYFDPALRALHAGEIIHWDFGDGRTTTGTLTPARAYRDNGEYTVTLTVTDTEGDVGQDWLLVTVLNIAPSVNAGPDRTAVPGEPLNFSGAFTDPGLDDTHDIVWDLGDGTTMVDILNFSHAYEAFGVYTVTLTVTDDDGGVGSDTAIVNVRHRVYLPLVSKSLKP